MTPEEIKIKYEAYRARVKRLARERAELHYKETGNAHCAPSVGEVEAHKILSRDLSQMFCGIHPTLEEFTEYLTKYNKARGI